jgi:hypothetical protein
MKPYCLIFLAVNLIHRLFSVSRINRRNFLQASRILKKKYGFGVYAAPSQPIPIVFGTSLILTDFMNLANFYSDQLRGFGLVSSWISHVSIVKRGRS